MNIGIGGVRFVWGALPRLRCTIGGFECSPSFYGVVIVSLTIGWWRTKWTPIAKPAPQPEEPRKPNVTLHYGLPDGMGHPWRVTVDGHDVASGHAPTADEAERLLSWSMPEAREHLSRRRQVPCTNTSWQTTAEEP
jgi:hypothetical protein